MHCLAGRLSLDRLSRKTFASLDTWCSSRFQCKSFVQIKENNVILDDTWKRGSNACSFFVASTGIDLKRDGWNCCVAPTTQDALSCRHSHSWVKPSGKLLGGKPVRNPDRVVMAFKILIQETDPKMWLRDEWDGALTDRWDQCKRIALANMDTVTSFRVANVINCCKQCRRIDVALLDEMMRAAIKNARIMEDFAPIGISMSIQSLGMLSRQARRTKIALAKFFDGTGKDFVLALLDESKRRSLWMRGESSPRVLAATMHGLGILFGKLSKNSGDQGAKLLEAVECIAREFGREENRSRVSLQDVSNIVYACELLGFVDMDFTMKACRFLIDRLDAEEKMNPLVVSNVLWSLGKMGFNDESVLSRLSCEIKKMNELEGYSGQSLSNVVYAFGLLEFHDVHLIDALLNEIIQPHRLPKFKELELSNIVYGLGRLHHSNDALIGQLCVELTKEHRLMSFSEQGLANIVYGLGKANFFERSIYESLMKEASQRLSKFSCQELSNVMYGLALVRLELSNTVDATGLLEFMELACLELHRRPKEFFDPQGLANLMWCLGVLRYYDGDLMDFMFEAYMEKEENMKAMELSMILISCAVHGHRNNRLFRAAHNYMLGWLPKLSEVRVVCNSMWAFAILGILSNLDFEQFCQKLASLESVGSKMVIEQWRQVLQAWMYIHVVQPEPGQYGLSFEVRSLLSKAKQNWRGHVLADHTSTFESSIREILLVENMAFTPKSKLLDGLLEVDFLLEHPTHPVVLECDGVWHYTINRPGGLFRLMGDTVFRNKLLEAAGYKVACLPFFFNRKEQIVFVQKLAQSMQSS